MEREYTAAEWRKFIMEVLEGIEDTKYLYKIYSLVAIHLRQEIERRGS